VPDKIVELICMDIDSLSRKILELLPTSQESVLAAGSLKAASYILKGESADPAPSRRQVASQVASRDNQLDMESLTQKVAARLDQPVDLAKQWSGTPLANGRSPRKKSAQPIAAPNSLCPGCEERVAGHPVVTAAGSDPKGRSLVQLCGGNGQVWVVPDRE
jgi:hypothetical protein